ncbi:hypothetical protein QYE76_050965 [Lolium multiflorum]|uniref:Probable threonine--tRNA ligase, cytoplasmic n=1 Tax=Lolium multiflorum TaxID=4521 RepID=A0AAD8SR11_LOLMU|nr:hypothetical protein QYE76_050965 [Lolium multiflorum]
MGKKGKSPAAPPEVVPDNAYLEAVTQKRIALFEAIQARQAVERLSIAGDPIRITLVLDGQVKEGKRWISTPMDVAKVVSSRREAASFLIARVNGALWDMARPLEGDCELELFGFDTKDGRDTFWHSSAHILGEALERAYGCKLCIGPCVTRGEGFYYDAYYGGVTLNEGHFGLIQAQARKAVDEKQPFERIKVSRVEALEMFAENQFKVEIIKELPEDLAITVYRCGDLVDLCRGPHIPNTSFVKAFACTNASSSYWRGKAERESLQRVYGVSFPDSKRLKDYSDMMEEAQRRDHRKLGQRQELFIFNPVSPGCCFFLPHGARILNKLKTFMQQEYWERGYEEVVTPNVYNMSLWETSGHAANYRENMFVFEVDGQEVGLKPMNCPGHCEIFRHRTRSYRELPLRMADFGVLHRNEASGALTGLTRVRRFVQDDAHIFCRESQVKDEVEGVLKFIDDVYKIFGFEYELELSTRPENYLGDVETWNRAEHQLKEALTASGKPWKVNDGDGAFYGPKIDIGVFDALKRKFQCATLQLDFQLPINFKLTYAPEEQGKLERPVMIHRAILGSFERMVAILLEHYGGKWPLWLSPRQAIICPLFRPDYPNEAILEYAKEVRGKIHKAGFYVDVDMTDETFKKKVALAQAAQYNYILTVGPEEVNSGEVTIRVRDKKDQALSTVSVDDAIRRFREEVAAFQ